MPNAANSHRPRTRDGAPFDWGGAADRSPPMSRATLQALLDGTSLVVSLSQDDYVRNYGGVQNLIGDERQAFSRRGAQYLHLSPAAPLPVLAEPAEIGRFRFAALLDGKHCGVVLAADLAAVLAALSASGSAIEFVVHHLMGHEPECVAMLLQAAGGVTPTVWVHDFFTICLSYALMRNDVAYCAAPPPDSGACGVCSYGAARGGHSTRVRSFFEATRPVVLAPSQAALDVWLTADLPHATAVVQPLARLVLAPAAGDNAHRAGRRLRVAHLGARVLHKGWYVFEELALRFADDGRYEFLQFGASASVPMPGCIRGVPVQVVPDCRDAMVEALAESGVDVVVAWSLWPETFCFTVHEALASGAFVVTRRDAGNMWPAVAANAPAQGCAVADIEALTALFAGDELVELCRRPRRRGAVLPGGATADRLEAPTGDGAAAKATARGATVRQGLQHV
jgi:hypothetical protein